MHFFPSSELDTLFSLLVAIGEQLHRAGGLTRAVVDEVDVRAAIAQADAAITDAAWDTLDTARGRASAPLLLVATSPSRAAS
jgi:hypothetical protein